MRPHTCESKRIPEMKKPSVTRASTNIHWMQNANKTEVGGIAIKDDDPQITSGNRSALPHGLNGETTCGPKKNESKKNRDKRDPGITVFLRRFYDYFGIKLR